MPPAHFKGILGQPGNGHTQRQPNLAHRGVHFACGPVSQPAKRERGFPAQRVGIRDRGAADSSRPSRSARGAIFTGEAFQSTLYAEPGRTYAIETSVDLVDWTALESLRITNTTTPIYDSLAARLAWLWYRARRL